MQITSASELQLDFMNLLIVQLQNQNPLEPMDNNEMASQLAQFSQLSQLESMNGSFEKALVAADRTYANSLIGKQVSFIAENQNGEDEVNSGIVDGVINNSDNETLLTVGNYVLGLDSVISVQG